MQVLSILPSWLFPLWAAPLTVVRCGPGARWLRFPCLWLMFPCLRLEEGWRHLSHKLEISLLSFSFIGPKCQVPVGLHKSPGSEYWLFLWWMLECLWLGISSSPAHRRDAISYPSLAFFSHLLYLTASEGVCFCDLLIKPGLQQFLFEPLAFNFDLRQYKKWSKFKRELRWRRELKSYGMEDIEGKGGADPWEAEDGDRDGASEVSSDGLPACSSSLLPLM